MPDQLVPVSTSDLALYREFLPKASLAIVERAISLGLAPEALGDIAEIQDLHGTSPAKVLEWIEETGARLEQIYEALEADRALVSFRTSPLALLRVARAVNPQIISISDFMDAFVETFEVVGGWFPLHRLVHFVDDELNGDWQKAYNLACEDPRTLITWLKGRIDELTVAHRETQGEVLSEELDEGEVPRPSLHGHHKKPIGG